MPETIFLLLWLQQTITLVNLVYGILVFVAFIAIAIAVTYYSVIRGKDVAEDHRIKPFKEAAEGWESLATQARAETERLTRLLESTLTDRKQIANERDELKEDLILAAKANFKLQGDVDQLATRHTIDIRELQERFASLERKLALCPVVKE